jgi:hypothetical protein
MFYINLCLHTSFTHTILEKFMKADSAIWVSNTYRHVGERRAIYRVLVGKPGRRPDIDGRIILIWIFRKWDVGVLTISSWLRIGTGGRHL